MKQKDTRLTRLFNSLVFARIREARHVDSEWLYLACIVLLPATFPKLIRPCRVRDGAQRERSAKKLKSEEATLTIAARGLLNHQLIARRYATRRRVGGERIKKTGAGRETTLAKSDWGELLLGGKFNQVSNLPR